jgi:hypothetical protein
MKNFTILGLLMAVFVITSCSYHDLQYSCDPEIDAWTKANIQAIQAMNRTDFLSLDYAHQKGAYEAMKPEQRVQIWVTKLEDVLKLDWTEQESIHLKTVLELIKTNSDVFSKERTQEAFDEFEIALYKWKEHAKEVLGWDKDLGNALIATPQEMNADKTIKSGLGTIPSKSGSFDCECSSKSNWCSNDYNCYTTNCEGSSLGCGNLWLYGCNGICLNADAVTGATLTVEP